MKPLTIYHVARDGESLGEFSEDEFRVQRATGGILPNDHYWTEGMAEWRAVRDWRAKASAGVAAPPEPIPVRIVPEKKKTSTGKAALITLLIVAVIVCVSSAGKKDADKREAAQQAEFSADIKARHVAIGMTAEQCTAAWGAPQKINRTVYSNHDREQWIYGREFGHEVYLYLEDGVMTSFQD